MSELAPILTGDVTLYHGDCLEVLRALPDGSVDAVVTDPPYGTGNWERPEAGAGKDCRAVRNLEEWDTWDFRWIDEALRVSRGPVAFFVPNGRIAEGIALATSRGLSWRLLNWCKPDPRPRFGGQTAYGFEPIVALRGLANTGDMDWFSCPAPRQNAGTEARVHPHQKPVAVMRWLCRLAAERGALICDPHMGSGSTGVGAIREGMRFVGIEQDAEHFETARRRLGGVEPPLFDAVAVTPLFADLAS